MTEPFRRLRRGARYVARPRWGLAYWRGRRGMIPEAATPTASLASRAEFAGEAATALAVISGRDEDYCARAMDEVQLPAPIDGDSPAWWPRERLMRIVGAVATLARPTVAVEIGVARGYSSAAILGALETNGEGRLHSIDLPPLEEDVAFVGKAVPAKLRERWQLRLGPSRTELPRLLAELGRCEFFFHDGDHSYESQFGDLRTVWPYVPAGGYLVVDDVWTAAVIDFADQQGESVALALGGASHDAIALIRKRGGS